MLAEGDIWSEDLEGREEKRRIAGAVNAMLGWTQASRAPIRLIAALVFVSTFVIRFLDARLHNEHIEIMSGGRQIAAFGELPVRDWVDPGRFLSYWSSALVQTIFGYSLFGEVLLSAASMAAAACLTFLVGARASRSALVGATVTFLSMAIYPRLYNHYKLLLLALGIYLCWRYVDKRDRLSLLVGSVATALALMTRQDFGAYLAVGFLTAIILVHAKRGLTVALGRSALYAGGVVAAMSPLLLFVHANGGIATYYRAALDFGRKEKDLFAISWPSLVYDSSSPSVFAVIHQDNANEWLFYLYYSLPALALLVLGLAHRGGLTRLLASRELPKIASAAVLAAAAIRVLLPHPSHSRLSDVGPVVAILGAWIIGRLVWIRSERLSASQSRSAPVFPSRTLSRSGWISGPRAGRLTSLAGVLLMVMLTAGAVIAVAQEEYEGDALFGQPVRLLRQSPEQIEDLLESPPIEGWSKPGSTGLRAVVRYVRDCTDPADRVFVTAYRPEVFFYSGRGFAGGVPFVLHDHFSEPRVQDRVVSTLQDQSVPIVLAEKESFARFREEHAIVSEYLLNRYRVAATSSFGSSSEEAYLVLVDRHATPHRSYGPDALPCFA